MNQISKLSNENLLGTFIPHEAALQLIAEHHTMYDALMNTTQMELSSIKNLGSSRIRRIQCLREIFTRLQNETRNQIKAVNSPKDIAAYLTNMENLQQEQFRVVALNTKNGIIAEKIITQGTVNASIVSPREVFHSAIRNMAASIIIAHNHPSGDPNPSNEDIAVTEAIVKVGDIMGIPVVDHVIIGKNRFYSFKESGLMKSKDT